jgi:hypothetical protein
MKIYKLTFADLEHGKVIAWKSNKPEIRQLRKQWKQKFPLRELVLTERIDVPTRNKSELIDWLNENEVR